MSILTTASRSPITGTAQADFHTYRYLHNNARRLEHLASLGLDLWNKRVLELGAGIGDLTSFFLDRDCRVTTTEPRAGNLELLAERYADDPRVVVHELSLDPPPATPPAETFDVVFFYGVLYHVSTPAEALDYASAATDGVLLLETICAPGDVEAINPTPEEVSMAGAAVSGMGCRPTRPWVFNRLKERFPNVYVPRTQPPHYEFPRQWPSSPRPCASRAIFIASRTPQNLPTLCTDLPSEYDRQA